MAQALRSDAHEGKPRGTAERRSDATESDAAPRGGALLSDAALLPDKVLGDLPPPGTRRWVPRHKAAVVAAVEAGVLTMKDAEQRYLLSEEELELWRDTIRRYGVAGLRMSVSERRAAPRMAVLEPGYVSVSIGERATCLIVDVSDRGARIETDATTALPGHFQLACAASGRAWWVDLTWQRGKHAGVRFANPLPPPFAIQAGLGAWLVGRRDEVRIDRA